MKNFLEQITIRAVAEGFDKVRQEVEKVQKPLDGLAKKLDSIGKTLTISVTAPLTAFAGLAIHEFAAAERAIAKVETQLRLTGERIGLTFDELQQASKDLQANSIFGDDDILEKVSGQLLRVSGLTKDTFLEAQQVVVDLASAMDTDLSTAALKVAKALEAPADALGALERDNIKFTKSQKDTIEALVKTGRQAEAQSLILEILRGKFQGIGEAISKTAFGQLAQLRIEFGNLAEVIGGRLFAALEPLIQTLTTMLRNLQNLNPEVLDFAIKLGAVAAVIGPVAVGVGLLAANFSLLVSPITVAVVALVGITSALDALAERFSFVSRIFSALNVITFSFLNVLLRVNQVIVLVLASIVNIGVALRAITGVGPDLTKLRDDMAKFADDIGVKATELGNIVEEEFINVFKGEKREILSVNDLFGDASKFMADLQIKGEQAGTTFGEGVKSGVAKVDPFAVSGALAADKLDTELNRVRDKFNELTETGQIFTNSFTRAFSALQSGTKSLADSFKDLGKSIVDSLFNAAIQNAFTSLFQNLGGVFTFGGVTAGAPNLTGQGFAAGGPVIGPGSTTSDSIPAWLSNKEFVMNAKAAQYWGTDILQRMNALGKGFRTKSKAGFPGFADGGPVQGSGGVTVNVINNSSQPVTARSDTRIDGRQIIVDTFLEDARVNGPMSQSIQNQYGVRR